MQQLKLLNLYNIGLLPHISVIQVKWCGGGLFEVGEEGEKKEVCLEEDYIHNRRF